MSGSVSDCVPCRWKHSFFGWQRSSKLQAVHVTRASGRTRCACPRQPHWELHHPVNVTAVSQARRLPAFAQLRPRRSEVTTKYCTPARPFTTPRRSPTRGTAHPSRSRNASSSEPPRRRAVQLRQVYAPCGPPSTLTLAALAGKNLHITRATTADLGTVKMGALMGGSTCPFTLLAPSFLCSSRPAHS